jgi:hypothetical protein
MKPTAYAITLGSLLFVISAFCFAETVNDMPPQQPVTQEMSVEEKRSSRVILLEQMIDKYEQQQIFEKMRQYMNDKSEALGKDEILESPQELIRETLERTRSVYEKVQPFVGNQFKRNYNPEEIEAKINKFAWLKGPAFLILKIRTKHKIALSFFYLPENETLKRSFLHDAVQYSYPEVLNAPENETWFASMNGVMERLGYKFFNVDKYIDAPQ